MKCDLCNKNFRVGILKFARVEGRGLYICRRCQKKIAESNIKKNNNEYMEKYNKRWEWLNN
jgi:ribosome-binding protein aMBF1 (putative translation factor)